MTLVNTRYLPCTQQLCEPYLSLRSRTPGSRQPSPAEEDLTKNGGLSLEPGVVILKPPEQLPPHLHHLPPQLAPHLGVTLNESVNQQFEHFGEQPPPGGPYDQQPHQYAPPPTAQPHQVDSAVLQQQQHNFDVQVRIFLNTLIAWSFVRLHFYRNTRLYLSTN